MRHEKNTEWPLLSGSSSVDALALLRRFLAFSYFRIAAVRQSFVEAGILMRMRAMESNRTIRYRLLELLPILKP
jgi:hypothetical protein